MRRRRLALTSGELGSVQWFWFLRAVSLDDRRCVAVSVAVQPCPAPPSPTLAGCFKKPEKVASRRSFWMVRRDAAATALQKLDQFAIKDSTRVKGAARSTETLACSSSPAPAQSALLNDQLKNRKGELEEKIGAVDQQIRKLKEQGGKLEAILEKISQLLRTSRMPPKTIR